VSDVLGQFLEGMQEELRDDRDLQLLKRCQEDKFFFAREVMGNAAVFPESLDPAVCGEWTKLFEFIYSFAAPGGIRLGVCNAPRNTYKTTLLVTRLADLIAGDRNIRILYTTNVHRLSMEFSTSLKQYLTHKEKLIEAYGPFAVDDSEARLSKHDDAAWRQDFWTVAGRTTHAKEPTFTAGSVGKSAVGNHFDVIVLDDCVDNDNTTTAESVRKTIDWFRLVGPLRDKKSRYGPGGCILDIGTRYVDGDLHGFLLGEVSDEKEQLWRDYTPLVLRAIANPECWNEKLQRFVGPILNFPHILTEEEMNTERRAGSYHFSTQFQNECVAPDDAHFRKDWFQLIPFYDVPQDRLAYYVFTDYAFGLDDSNDRTALWVVGLDWERKAYCVDFDVGRWTLTERCKRTMDFAQKYDCRKISLEQISANEGIKSTLLRMRDERRLRCSLEEIGGRSTESKMMRITSLQPRFEQRRIFFAMRDAGDMFGIRAEFIRLNKNGEVDSSTDIAKEFLRFPRATHDDIPDALSDIDKIDNSTRTYFFAGFPRSHVGPNVPQPLGPRTVNGRVVYNSWDEWRGINAISQDRPKEDLYTRAASRIAGRRPGLW